MQEKEIRIKTDIGTLLLYACEKTQSAGIILIPEGTDEEIDIAYATCIDADGNDSYKSKQNRLIALKTYIYEDVYDENYTRSFTIDGKDAHNSVTESYQPDSAKL